MQVSFHSSDEVTNFVEHALRQGGPQAAARVTNSVFQHVTGIDPYDLTDIFSP